MIKNFIKTAFRHFWKYRSFSIINIFGLALSMAVCFLLIIIIKDANSYDLFNKDGDRIYRINTDAIRKDGGHEPYASSPYTVASSLVTNYPVAEASTSLIRGLNGDIISGEKRFAFNGFFTNPSFFDVFSFTLKDGNRALALQEPFTIILTDLLANKLFPSGNAMGQTVEIKNLGLFKVTGVLNEFPGKTHLEYEALASLSTVPALEKNKSLLPVTDDWLNYYATYSYIKLKPEISASNVEKILAGISNKQYKNLSLESRDKGYTFRLQALNKISPGPLLSNNMGKALPQAVLWFMGVLAFVIILFAAFNYTNLTVAKAMSRMKEIALRKVVGSSRKQVFFQIITESIITAVLAFVVALCLLRWLMPQFESLSFVSVADIRFVIDLPVILLCLVFTFVVGIIAGIIPASVLSRVKPLMLMNKLQNLKMFRHLGMRKAMLVIQFMVSIVFVVMVTITYRQMQHAININFGTAQTNIFNIHLQGQDYQKAKQEFSEIPGVGKISAVSQLMGNYSDMSDDVKINNDKDPVTVREYFTDENYISNFKLQLVAGKNFPADPSQKHEKFLIVNEKFIADFKLGTPAEAIGKTLVVGDSITLSVLGVVKDFLYKPAEYSLEPMMMRYDPGQWQILNLGIASANTVQTVAQLESTWKKMDPYHSFQGKFYNKEIQSIFSEMKDVIWMVAFIALIGITISCLGLLGITIFTVQSKAKEISIRKVIGADALSIAKMLSKNYVQVILIAIGLAIPVAYFLGYTLLQAMRQHITLTPLLFVPGILLIIFLSALTIGFQTMKAIFSNPVKSLRTE
ncbi:MAG: ABC transporter permease [Ginsengibacter sp.]